LSLQPAFLVFAASLVVIAVCLVLLTFRQISDRAKDSKDGRFPEDSDGKIPRTLVVFLLCYGLTLAAYFILRFDGRWAESDSSGLTVAINAVLKSSGLTPAQGYYMHGIGYQVVGLTLLFFTGLTAPQLQTQLFPYLAVLGLILTSYAFFRVVTRNNTTAVLASMLVLFQPDILFVTLRGSHEKLTWPLMMLALTLLYHSVGKPLRKMVFYVIFFYLVVFTMITTNVFFGSVFLFAILISMILGLVILRIPRFRIAPLPQQDVQRLMYISLSGGILVFIFMAYLYPPALANFREFNTIIDQISALLLSFEVGAMPYAYISYGWISPWVYLALTVFTWGLVVTSLIEWVRRAGQLYQGRSRQGLVENIDWLLYSGFVVQIAVSVVIDFAGWLAANLQLRLFPGFTVIAICLLVRRLQEILASPAPSGRARRLAPAFIAPVVIWFAAASILKASNEPMLSNKWSFYTRPEFTAMQWVESRFTHTEIWSGFDERMMNLFRLLFISDSLTKNAIYRGDFRTTTRYIFYTSNDRIREVRLDLESLPIESWDQIYDNGEVQIYHLSLFNETNP
jgi:hypothetical protein